MILRGEARDSADTLSLRPPRPSPWPSQRAWCTTSRRTGRSAVVVLLIIAAPAPELRHGQLQRRLGELHVAVVRRLLLHLLLLSGRPLFLLQRCPRTLLLRRPLARVGVFLPRRLLVLLLRRPIAVVGGGGAPIVLLRRPVVVVVIVAFIVVAVVVVAISGGEGALLVVLDPFPRGDQPRIMSISRP